MRDDKTLPLTYHVARCKCGSAKRSSNPQTMERQIVSFRQDDVGDWVAVLACGHGQHVRHNPPMFERPWVQEAEGRARFIGYALNCRICDGDDFHNADASVAGAATREGESMEQNRLRFPALKTKEEDA